MSDSKKHTGPALPLLPLRRGLLFPGTIVTLPVGRARSKALVESLEAGTSIIATAVQMDPRIKTPTRVDLHPVGVKARVVRIQRNKDRMYALTLEGLGRIEIGELRQADPFWTTEVRDLPDTAEDIDEAVLLAEALQRQLRELDPDGAGSLARIAGASFDPYDPGALADRVASALDLRSRDQIAVLLAQDASERLRLVAGLVGAAISSSDVRKTIEDEVRRSITKDQREAMLRQQLRAIQKQLGEGEGGDAQDKLRERLEAINFPAEAQGIVDKELRRLEGLNPNHAEYNVVRTYLEWMADLPWDTRAESDFDVDDIEAKLDADHFGLKDVKQRILEHMAVLKVAGHDKATILCLYGPPGVGKTSIVKSIAESTGRPYVRIALGGVRDEAEIRGHRRTYVGALPGRLINAMKKAKVKNPIILLDEIDKLGRGWQGSPDSALLEVLDPEQNHVFQDHYLETPFDLSEVLFVCTANALDTLSPPLRDRLEIVELNGYTQEEKATIARRHLLPRQLASLGVEASNLDLTEDALKGVIKSYTREAGVRQLDRQLARIVRAMILEVARSGSGDEARSVTLKVDTPDLEHYLGTPRFSSEVAERTSIPGVATGMAWTPVGGDILFIETSRMPGKGRLEITGQLGDVMKESARAALTYVRSNAGELGVDPEFLETQDLHIHVPAGAVPKDGPSAGVTMFTALTSLLTGRRVRADTAMTGEATLRGRVLPVGGIKAKVLAAHRAGLTRIILPKRNERDLKELPDAVRESLTFFLAEDMSAVLAAALEEDSTSGERGLTPSGEELGNPGAVAVA